MLLIPFTANNMRGGFERLRFRKRAWGEKTV